MTCKKEIEELRKRLDKLEKQCVDEMQLCDQQGRLLRGLESGGGTYWTVDSVGYVFTESWKDDQYALNRLKQGSVFIDKLSAEKEAERREVIQELRVLAAQAWHESGTVLDWGDDNQYKYYIYSKMGIWSVHWWITHNIPVSVYFPCEETAKAAIEKLGKRLDVLL